MADFVDTMHQWKRMCDAMERGAPGDGCKICPLLAHTDRGCAAIFDMPNHTDWDAIESEIHVWAERNPEPVYPTWREWLTRQYQQEMCERLHNGIFPDIDLEGWMSVIPIPADIAAKLGIEPREDV